MKIKPIQLLFDDYLDYPASCDRCEAFQKVEDLMTKYGFTDEERTAITSFESACLLEAFTAGVVAAVNPDSHGKDTPPFAPWQINSNMIWERTFWQNVMNEKFPADSMGKNDYMNYQVLGKMMGCGEFNDCISSDAYNTYKAYCEQEGLTPWTQTKFSKIALQNLPVYLYDERVNGTKTRVFHEKVFNLHDWVK